jgi:hypothetical protein
MRAGRGFGLSINGRRVYRGYIVDGRLLRMRRQRGSVVVLPGRDGLRIYIRARQGRYFADTAHRAFMRQGCTLFVFKSRRNRGPLINSHLNQLGRTGDTVEY